MKTIIVLICVFIFTSYSNAQNTYPSTGNVGIGTVNPLVNLDVRGNLLLDNGGSPILYTNAGNGDAHRYLQLINSPTVGNAAGLKVGGLLVSDMYNYANPDKNDMVIKGKLAIGMPTN